MQRPLGNQVVVALLALLCVNCPILANEERELLYQDDFDADLSKWHVEQAEGGSVKVEQGKLVIDDAKGCSVWFKTKLNGPIVIEFDVVMVQQGGKHDRVSDLNCFWMAVDPREPGNLFANTTRGGIFKNYDSLRLYYVGYGANNNTTTRLRKYPGDGSRPCLPEHNLKLEKFLNRPNVVTKIQIISNQSKQQFLRDGEVVFSFEDETPYTEGWFGFRTVRNHMLIDNFRVYSIGNEDI